MTADRPPRRRRRHAAPPPRKPAAVGPGAAPPASRPGEPPARDKMWLYGRHAVAAALANPRRRWRRLAVLAAQEAEGRALVGATRARHVGDRDKLQIFERGDLSGLLPEGAVHQGLALEVEPLAEPDLETALRQGEAAPPPHIVVALDQVSDPHNVGAVLRSAAAFGALAVIVVERGAPPVTGALAKAASGALEAVPLLRVVNLARTLDRLKAAGFWVCGLDETAPAPLPGLDLGDRVALVLGSEGAGLRRLVRERCDHVAHLPTRGPFASLNISNAAAVALYEITRTRPPPR